MDPMEHTVFYFKDACLLVRYVAINVLLLSRGLMLNVFTESLPINKYTSQHITNVYLQSIYVADSFVSPHYDYLRSKHEMGSKTKKQSGF
jgi:hypothetical protein